MSVFSTSCRALYNLFFVSFWLFVIYIHSYAVTAQINAYLDIKTPRTYPIVKGSQMLLRKVYKLRLIAYSNLVTVKIELSQSQYDDSSSIATRLNQENALKEPTIEELILSTLRILIKEYEENPQSVIAYFLKRNSLDSKDGQR